MQTLEQTSKLLGLPPKMRRWTVSECETLQKLGLLTGPFELIEGMVIGKLGSGGKHSQLVCLLMVYLMRFFDAEQLRVQLPVQIGGAWGEYNAPEPDVAVTRQSARAYDENPEPEEILLVAEVSDSSLRFDLSTKADLYARVGIPEYWVVDVEGVRLIAHRLPTEQGYAEITEWQLNESIAPVMVKSEPVPLTSLFV